MDPVFSYIISLGLSLLFASAAMQKLRALDVFAEILKAYRILPDHLCKPIARLIPALELMLSMGLLIPVFHPAAGAAAGVILAGYGFAMALNIYRGNLSLDCGCQLGPARQTISIGLVVRNVVFALAALSLLLPETARSLTYLDIGTVAFGLTITSLLYLTLNTLLANHSTYREINS